MSLIATQPVQPHDMDDGRNEWPLIGPGDPTSSPELTPISREMPGRAPESGALAIKTPSNALRATSASMCKLISGSMSNAGNGSPLDTDRVFQSRR